MTNIIYALVDPTTDFIRYVGLSTSGLNRPKRHLDRCFYNSRKAHVYSWIKACLSKNTAPRIEVLEECHNKKDLIQAEIFWISYLKFLGSPLTNHTDGGEGLKGHKQSKEQIEKRVSKTKGKKRSQEFCDRLSRLNTGKILSEETKAKMSAAKKGQPSPNKGKTASAGTRLKQSLAKLGKVAANRQKLCDSLGNKFCSITAAAAFHKISQSYLRSILAGKNKILFPVQFRKEV